ncbi:MAG: XRE family transcriptional regulator [Clostridia bacterium]|nr:XRE family transcriptional regulator [Clostridia bacterium]
MYTDIQKLKEKIVEKNTTQEAVADAINIDRSTFYRKMKANGSRFSIGEVHRIIDALPLTKEEAVNIFLASQSQ